MLEEIIATTVDLRLYTSDVKAGLTAEEIDALTEADFTEATFPGYTAASLSVVDWAIAEGNPSTAVGLTPETFTRTVGAGTETIYGYFYTRSSDGELRAFEQFKSSVQIATPGDSISITPTLNLDDREGSDVAPGMMMPIGFADAPTGWLLCDGAAVSRTTYSELFAAIGVAFGVGDGATTFNVPDMRGRFPLGQATSGTGSALADTGGQIDHVHTLAGAGAAAAVYFEGGGNTAYVREVAGVGSWTRTEQLTGGTIAGASGTSTDGAELLGDSDTENPPFLAIPWAIKT